LSLSKALRRYISLPIASDQSAQLVPGLGGDSSRILKHGGNSASTRRLISIAAIEEEKDHQASQWVEDQRMLAEARAQGKEAHTAAKARIAQEREATVQAKKIERLRATAEHQAEKARVAAENKARQLERKVHGHCLQSQFHQATHDSKAAKRKATSQTVEGLPRGGTACSPSTHQPHNDGHGRQHHRPGS
jgi:hypothetical protein